MKNKSTLVENRASFSTETTGQVIFLIKVKNNKGGSWIDKRFCLAMVGFFLAFFGLKANNSLLRSFLLFKSGIKVGNNTY